MELHGTHISGYNAKYVRNCSHPWRGTYRPCTPKEGSLGWHIYGPHTLAKCVLKPWHLTHVNITD